MTEDKTLVERLRDAECANCGWSGYITDEAADHIEAQAAEIARLRDHIGIIRDEAERPNSTWPHIKRVIGNAARQALGKQP